MPAVCAPTRFCAQLCTLPRLRGSFVNAFLQHANIGVHGHRMQCQRVCVDSMAMPSTPHQASIPTSDAAQRFVQHSLPPCTTFSINRQHMRSSSSSVLPSAAISAAVLLLMADAALAEGDVGATQLSADGVSTVLQSAVDYASSLGDAGGVAVFIATYVVATVLLVPGSLITLAAGALYGPLRGTAIVSIASTLGAMAAFCVARYGARPWVEKQLSGFPKAQAVVAGVSKEGGWLVFLLRLSPLVPFTLLNYALGLTEVSLTQYTLASWIGMLPGTFAYVYLGGAGRAAVDAAGASNGVPPEKLALWGLGAVATLAATKLISGAASKALAEAEAAGAGGSSANGREDKAHQ